MHSEYRIHKELDGVPFTQTPCLLPLLHTLLKNQPLTVSNPIASQSEAGSHFGFVLAMVAAARSPLCCAWEVSVLNESAGYQRCSECTEAARFSDEHLISSPASMGPSFSCRETEESLTWVDLLFLPQPPSALQAVRRGQGPVWEEAVAECSRCGLKEGNDSENSRTPLDVRYKDIESKKPPCENHSCCLSGFGGWPEVLSEVVSCFMILFLPSCCPYC